MLKVRGAEASGPQGKKGVICFLRHQKILSFVLFESWFVKFPERVQSVLINRPLFLFHVLSMLFLSGLLFSTEAPNSIQMLWSYFHMHTKRYLSPEIPLSFIHLEFMLSFPSLWLLRRWQASVGGKTKIMLIASSSEEYFFQQAYV